ncbi:MAG TPA: hypothetical protein VG755_04000 [Nannocystaceae bacterium]|nr:hypothetical protein [Nannocystaceae bacterium]
MSFAFVLLAFVAPPRSVDELAAQAEAAFANEDYDAVTAALREAYAIDPRPTFVYGLAQADRLGGRCDAAIDHYATYLALDPPDGPAEEARLGVPECRAVLDARDAALALAQKGATTAARELLLALQRDRGLVDVPELALALGDVEREAGRCDDARASYDQLARLHAKAEVLALAHTHGQDCPIRPAAPPPRPVVDAPRDPPPPPSKPRPWHRDPAAVVLASVGATGVALGIGLVAGSIRWQRGATSLADEGEFADRKQGALRMHVAGWSVLAAGSALVIGSVARWGWLATHRRGRSNTAAR